MPNTDAAVAYARQNKTRAVEDLRQLIRIPSISMTPEYKPEVQRAAEWVAQRLKSLGVEGIEIMPTAGHPVVYGHWQGAGEAPTVLVYGHYDVQPVDPLDLWKSDPFEAEQRGENLYGRGASDMKGQLIALLHAFERRAVRRSFS
jgi:acetylornithine deacetylase/succinyl-diaminopimelate desuccinylase-like protein